MRTLGPISDPGFTQPVYSRVDRFWLRFLKDERDLPFIYLGIRITFIIIPLAVLLYMPFITGWLWGVLAVVYLYLNNLVFKGPFGLMLHCTSHRPLFKPEYKNWYYYVTWVLAPFFGQTPETYYSHHIGMHHPENNVNPDRSTTMPYQRDSFRSFLAYFGSFFFFGVYELLAYLRPAMHWTEHPAFFQKTIDKYAINQAIIFEQLDFLGVFVNLMRKRYDVLASHVVNVNGAFRDDAEIEAMLRQRARRIR